VGRSSGSRRPEERLYGDSLKKNLERHLRCRLREGVRLALAIVSLASIPDFAVAQEAAPARPVRLLIDCVDTSCDQEFFRTAIAFVAQVRERQDADVHLMITSQATGAGGREINFSFYGQGRFTGRNQVLRHTFPVAESDDAVRREMARVISLGLVTYALESSALDNFALTSLPRDAASTLPGSDPWNGWIVRSQFSGNGTGERSNQTTNVSGSVTANRTVEDFKVNLSFNGSYSESRFELPGGQQFVSPRHSYGTNVLLVQSMGGQWSAGVRAASSASTFQNIDHAWYIAPAVEYNVFPYAQSTQRLLTLQYSLGVRSFDYEAETVFGKLSERKAAQLVTTALTLRQRWGTVGSGLDVLTYLPDTKYNQVSGWGDLDLSLWKGFSLNFSGEVSSVADQLYLARGVATAEEILVRQRQLATGYQYYYSFGVGYTFGSIYSPVVNPRLDRGGF
jgi:hypothetical protein